MPTIDRPGRRNIWRDDWGLLETPFRVSAIHDPDNPDPYEKAMYGEQYEEFYEKFFLNPLQKETNRQVIGAVWSTYEANRLGKGNGKSMLMDRESTSINKDLGASKLREFGVSEASIAENPFVAGFCTFKKSNEVNSFPAAILEAVKYILGSEYGDDHNTVHKELRRRICERIDAEEGFEGTSIRRHLERRLRGYQTLGLQLTHKKVKEFIDGLCDEDTAQLRAAVDEIGPRIKASQGFHFVHIFNTFLRLAGVEYVVYFVDQIENFAKYTNKKDRDIRVLREAICETSPTHEMASFIFQMHVQAQEVIEDWWENIEHLPSLDPKKRINSTRIVDLKGLDTKREAVVLAEKYLDSKRVPGFTPPRPLHPFNEDIIEEVRRSQAGNPRKFLEQLGAILDQAVADNRSKLDLAYVQPLLEEIPEAITQDQEDEEYSNVER
jgi:hypothetical protein